MAIIFGRANVPGLPSYTSFEYACVHGITPGIVTMTIPAEGFDLFRLPGEVDVELTDGERRFTLTGCLAVDISRVQEGDGVGYRVTLYDRRWTWKDTVINGVYNELDPLGKIKPESRKTVHELAILCLRAMNVNRWFLGDLPNPAEDEALPFIQWDNQNAAAALADLCDLFKVRVVYQPIADNVLLAAPGKGLPLPTESFTNSHTPARSAPRRPDILRLEGAPACFGMSIVLEAVGEELDGSVVPISKLSYKPVGNGGWAFAGAGFFGNLNLDPKFQAKGKLMSDAVAAAQRSVFRWYRATIHPADGKQLNVPGLTAFKASNGNPAKLADANQLILLDRTVGNERDNNKKLWVCGAQVFGIRVGPPLKVFNVVLPFNTSATEPVGIKFQVDSDRNLVIFDSYVYQVNATANARNLPHPVDGVIQEIPAGGLGPAELTLVTSVHIRDEFTRAPLRYTSDRKIANGKPNTVRVIRREDVQFTSFTRFKTGEWIVRQTVDNKKECDAAAKPYLDTAEQEFQEVRSNSRTYPRLVRMDPDGAIQEVVWRIGGGITTTVSRNSEQIRWIPPFIIRRKDEKLKAAVGAGLLGGGAIGTQAANANSPTG